MKMKIKIPYEPGATKLTSKQKEMAKMVKNATTKMAKQNVDTGRKVQEVLAQLTTKKYTVLAKYGASKGKPHEVRIGSNNMVFCTGRCWQYSKTGTCKHIEHFKVHSIVQEFGRIEKQK